MIYPRRTTRWTAWLCFYGTEDTEEIDIFSERKPTEAQIVAEAEKQGYDPDEFRIIEVRR